MIYAGSIREEWSLTALVCDDLRAIAEDGSGSFICECLHSLIRETFVSEPNSNRNPNELFGKAELWLVRFVVFLIFLVGLGKVLVDTVVKLLK
jgi:hypothetical protein